MSRIPYLKNWRKLFHCFGLCLFFLGASLTVPTSQASENTTFLVIGDSLSAAYGLNEEQGWVSLLAQALQEQHPSLRLINASVGGDTTDDGIQRLPKALQQYTPDWVILELGANDGLRGLPLPLIRENLQTLIELAQKANAKVLLIGMQIPPNYGKRYADGFATIYEELAQQYDTALHPFLFEGFAQDPTYFQEDGIHPNALGQQRIAEQLKQTLEDVLPTPD